MFIRNLYEHIQSLLMATVFLIMAKNSATFTAHCGKDCQTLKNIFFARKQHVGISSRKSAIPSFLSEWSSLSDIFASQRTWPVPPLSPPPLSTPLLPNCLQMSQAPPPHCICPEQPCLLWPHRTIPPPCPCPHTSARKLSSRTSCQICGWDRPGPQGWRWCCWACAWLSGP